MNLPMSTKRLLSGLLQFTAPSLFSLTLLGVAVLDIPAASGAQENPITFNGRRTGRVDRHR